MGTLASLALLPLIPERPAALAAVLGAGSLAAVWLCGRAEEVLGRHDDPRIVLDEIVAFWAAVAFLPRTPGVLAAGFVLFRAFDAFKPPPCGALERLPGGWGVVGDDLGAALWTNLLIRAVSLWWPALVG